MRAVFQEALASAALNSSTWRNTSTHAACFGGIAMAAPSRVNASCYFRSGTTFAGAGRTRPSTNRPHAASAAWRSAKYSNLL
jgi:hypothetical protein